MASIQGTQPALFSYAVCIGKKKAINSEDWFVLRLDMEPTTLEARSSNNVEIIRHTVWAYFSQRKLAYCHLLRRRGANNENVYRETTMESLIDDYQPVDGINIARSLWEDCSVTVRRTHQNTDGGEVDYGGRKRRLWQRCTEEWASIHENTGCSH